jgi:hypothetical protein
MSITTQKRAPLATATGPAVETLRAKVTDLIPEYHLVHLETIDGRGLSLTTKTTGVDLASLRVGQTVECVVTLAQPRVLQARALAQ